MKLFQVAVLFIFCPLLSMASDGDDTLQNSKSRIKSIIEYSYEAEERVVNGDTVFVPLGDTSIMQEFYNENGKLIEHHNWHGKERYVYNDDGTLVTEYTNKDSVWYKSVGYGVRFKNATVCDTAFTKLAIRGIAIQKLNKKLQVTELRWREPSGRIFLSAKNKYDNHGNEVASVVYSPHGWRPVKYRKKYDSHGRQTEELYLMEDKSLSKKRTYTYDRYGNRMSEKCYYLEGKQITNCGYIIPFIQYDDQGNWTRQVEYQFGNPNPVIRIREIEYY